MYFKEDELLETRNIVFVSAISLLVVHSAVAQLKQNLTIQPWSRQVHHELSYDWSIRNFSITRNRTNEITRNSGVFDSQIRALNSGSVETAK